MKGPGHSDDNCLKCLKRRLAKIKSSEADRAWGLWAIISQLCDVHGIDIHCDGSISARVT